MGGKRAQNKPPTSQKRPKAPPKISDDKRKLELLKEAWMKKQAAVKRKFSVITEELETAQALLRKAKKISRWIKKAKKVLIYTGAGISTAAGIPDYRGPNGIWTRALIIYERLFGKEVARAMANVERLKKELADCPNMLECKPTASHMIIREMYKRDFAHHVLSQNCDGLHVRSGLPQIALSEIHGNMFVEVCQDCSCQHIRTYDCTTRSAHFSHNTGRLCDYCEGRLEDTIVHYGEKSRTEWPQNWNGIRENLKDVDVILCVGTSLAVLRSYEELWPKRAKLVIVNLQWTLKDNAADMKVAAACDDFFEALAHELGFKAPKYCRGCDPLLFRKEVEGGFNPNLRNDLLWELSECTCGGANSDVPLPELPPDAPDRSEAPGWWVYGQNQILCGVGVKFGDLTDLLFGANERQRPRSIRTAPTPERGKPGPSGKRSVKRAQEDETKAPPHPLPLPPLAPSRKAVREAGPSEYYEAPTDSDDETPEQRKHRLSEKKRIQADLGKRCAILQAEELFDDSSEGGDNSDDSDFEISKELLAATMPSTSSCRVQRVIPPKGAKREPMYPAAPRKIKKEAQKPKIKKDEDDEDDESADDDDESLVSNAINLTELTTGWSSSSACGSCCRTKPCASHGRHAK
ncbi:unnamed protein product, partial [Mesorhabditis spiculigera]